MAEETGDNWIFDSLVNFLHGNIWKVPVLGFVEEKSVVFDPDSYANLSEEKEAEFRRIHEEYKTLVDYMLSSLMDDLQVTPEQVEEACLQRGPTTISDSHITKVALEQLQAAEDFTIFRKIMTRKNIDLQLQSLEILVAKYGVVSPSLKAEGGAPPTLVGDTTGEDDFLQVVIRYCGDSFWGEDLRNNLSSLSTFNKLCTTTMPHHHQYDKHSGGEQSETVASPPNKGPRATTQTQHSIQIQDKAIVHPPPQITNPIVPESLRSQLMQQDLADADKVVSNLQGQQDPTGECQESKHSSEELPQKLPPSKLPSLVAPAPEGKKKKEGKKSVKFDETTVAEIATVVAPEQHRRLTSVRRALESNDAPESLKVDVQGSEEDIEQRREYLKTQRDKLVALKKLEREKQLVAAASSTSSRPKSARAAQNALTSPPVAGVDKSLAARRAIAKALKQELFDR